MIVINSVEMIKVSPFKNLDWVRRSCAEIVSLISRVADDSRISTGKIDDLIIRMMIRLIIIRPVMVGMNDLNIAGSNEEKMSGVMQDSGWPNGDFEGL